ncbi:hypothetical protein C8Q80DRAFT_542572 [Daedaleopsis nitida]|nr:hypothetical protein C8Q80DRAFT_542572 [Daedaleopsis nitida]
MNAVSRIGSPSSSRDGMCIRGVAVPIQRKTSTSDIPRKQELGHFTVYNVPCKPPKVLSELIRRTPISGTRLPTQHSAPPFTEQRVACVAFASRFLVVARNDDDVDQSVHRIRTEYRRCNHWVTAPDETVQCDTETCIFSPRHPSNCNGETCKRRCWQYRQAPQQYTEHKEMFCPKCVALGYR